MGNKKVPKDPDAPKKPIRPFIYFMMTVGKEVREEMSRNQEEMGGNQQAEVTREVGKRWKALTEGEKEIYQEMFRKDTIRYQEAMKSYTPSAEYEEKVRIAQHHNTTASSTTDHNRNTGSIPYMTRAYFEYMANTWATVAAQHPRLGPGQVQEEVWRRWSQGEPGGVSDCDENKNAMKKQRKKRIRKRTSVKKTDAEPPRTAFQCFLSTMKGELRKHLPDMPYNDLQKHVAAKWKVMSEVEKEPFFELEKKEKEKYEIQAQEKLTAVECKEEDMEENSGFVEVNTEDRDNSGDAHLIPEQQENSIRKESIKLDLGTSDSSDNDDDEKLFIKDDKVGVVKSNESASKNDQVDMDLSNISDSEEFKAMIGPSHGSLGAKLLSSSSSSSSSEGSSEESADDSDEPEDDFSYYMDYATWIM